MMMVMMAIMASSVGHLPGYWLPSHLMYDICHKKKKEHRPGGGPNPTPFILLTSVFGLEAESP